MTKRKTFLLAALLMTAGIASAQVTIKGDVHGGGYKGKVKNPSATVYGNAAVDLNEGTVEGNVYGGGRGFTTDRETGLVEGNTTVTMVGGKVLGSLYGGGELGSVGTGILDDKNSGVSRVIISGGEVGVNNPSTTEAK